MGWLLVATVVCFVLGSKYARAKRYREYLDAGVARSVSIAQNQGWVSPHRLHTQADVTNKQAQVFLHEACKRRVLFQAVDGLYYTMDRLAG